MIFSGNDSYKIGLIAFGTFLLVYLNMFTSFSSISKKYIELGKIYEKNHWIIFSSISFPNSLEIFLTSLRFSIAISWIVLFVVEYSNSLANTGGLGYLIQDFKYTGKVEEMFASVLILAIVSYLLDKSIVLIMKRKLKWTDKDE
jgi:ABC-type nitrate/sulfonate/bicarbonate transport system permease component